MNRKPRGETFTIDEALEAAAAPKPPGPRPTVTGFRPITQEERRRAGLETEEKETKPWP